MSISAKKKLILCSAEGTYGTDATPGGANAFVVSNVSITPLEADTIGRDLLTPNLGAEEVVHVGAHVSLSFSVENQSSGTPGTAPLFAPALLACAMAETVNDATSVVYSPVSEGFGSATIYYFEDNILHKVVGCRGTFGFGFEAKNFSKLSFSFVGLYAGPVKQAAPTANWTGWLKPLPVGKANTTSFQLHGFAGQAHKLSVEVGNKAEYLPTLTTEEIRISERAASGSVTIDTPDLDAIDFIERVRTNETGNLTLTHGKTAGEIVQFTAPKVQLLSPKYADVAGTSTLEMGFNLLPNSGNDEFTLTFK